MKYAYDEFYLNDVQKNLGFFFQGVLRLLRQTPEQAQSLFLESEIPYQIEIGNPNFLCGKSGIEFLMLACKSAVTDKTIAEAQDEFFYPQAEYWSGNILATYQWQTGFTFQRILEKFPLARILDHYQLMHEADFSKMTALMDDVIQ